MIFAGARAFRPKRPKYRTSVVLDAEGKRYMQVSRGTWTGKMPLPDDFDEWPEARRQNLVAMAAEEMTKELRKGIR